MAFWIITYDSSIMIDRRFPSLEGDHKTWVGARVLGAMTIEIEHSILRLQLHVWVDTADDELEAA